MADENARSPDWKREDPPSGSDPRIEDDLVAKEKELRKMTQDGDAPSNPDEEEDEVENPENLVAQADDPEAQES